jgi:AcrR family transcriptional regulator
MSDTVVAPARRRLPPEVRREQVLDAALSLLSTRGYSALSVEGIAREAGVSKTVVYDAFGSLGRLLNALLAREERRALNSLAEAAAALPAGSGPTQAVIAWAMSLAQAVTGDPVTWRLMLIPPEGTPELVRERVQRGRDIALDQARALVGAVFDGRPELAGLDPELAARALLATAEDGARLLVENPEEFTPARLANFAAALLTALTR